MTKIALVKYLTPRRRREDEIDEVMLVHLVWRWDADARVSGSEVEDTRKRLREVLENVLHRVCPGVSPEIHGILTDVRVDGGRIEVGGLGGLNEGMVEAGESWRDIVVSMLRDDGHDVSAMEVDTRWKLWLRTWTG